LADISSLTCQLSRFDIPRPIAMLHTLLRLDRNDKLAQPWFRALEVWSEIEEILESDTFGAYVPLAPIIEASLSGGPYRWPSPHNR